MEFSGYFLSIESSDIFHITISRYTAELDISGFIGTSFLETVRLRNGDMLYFGDHDKTGGLTKAVEIDGLAAPMTGNILVVGHSHGEFLPCPRMTINSFAERTRIVTPVIEFLQSDKTFWASGQSSIKTRLRRTAPRVCVGDACAACPG